MIEDLILKRRRQVNTRTVTYFVASLAEKLKKKLLSKKLNQKIFTIFLLLSSIDLLKAESKLYLTLSILGLVRKILVVFGVTAANLLDPTSLSKAEEIDRNILPTIAKPMTICILKELNLIQSKCSNSAVNAVIKSIRSVGKRAQTVKTAVNEDGDEFTQSSEQDVVGKHDALWRTSTAEEMIDLAKELI